MRAPDDNTTDSLPVSRESSPDILSSPFAPTIYKTPVKMKPRIKSAGENHTPTTSRSLTAKASSPTSANLPKLKFKNYRKGSQSLRVLPRKDPKSPPQDLARSITMQTLSYGSPPTVARSVVRPQFGASIYDFPSSPTPTANQNTAASIYDFRDDDFEAPTAVRRKTSRFAYGKETGKTIVSPEY